MEAQTQTPVQVQVVPTQVSTPEDRFAAHLERMGSVPTMTEGDRAPRAPQSRVGPQDAPKDTHTEPANSPSDAAPSGDAPEGEENYEFDYDGDRYQVPAKLKALHEVWEKRENMDRDYTQKSQELAETRRAAEAMMQQARQHRELQTALAPQVSQLNAVNERLQQYMKVDWNTLFTSDPNAAQQHSVQFSVLNNQKQALEREINSTAQAHVTKLTESQKQLRDASDKAMAQKLKGWTPDTRNSLNDFARKSYGFTETEVSDTLDPRALEMMNDAKQWRDLQSSKAQKVVAPQKTLKPAASQAGNSDSEKVTQLKRALKLAKTDGDRDKAAQALLATRIR